jgi:hypothetical protein
MGAATLHSLSEIDSYVRAMALAPDVKTIASILNTYLSSWPEDRVGRLQTVDGGWAPFDQWQHPMPVLGARDIFSLARSIRDQCKAVREAGIEMSADLLELDLVLFFAAESAGVHGTARALATEYA